jgi:hypothetical protein
MLLFLHGENGALDELAIAVAAFVVLWVAVKLAGRKPAEVGEEDEDAPTMDEPAQPRARQ